MESYKLLLSQLSPELTKNSAALAAMGRNIAILSKTMGGDTRAAAEVLTTAMNQYGVSLADPMEASRKMAEMMNIMAAAGREGSAELPTIKVALEQCGMAAKAAGVSFAETNAAIQVLDKAGKKGSEGGIALRNVMTTLARGRFLPKDVRDELSAAGIDINRLTDQSKNLTERLSLLKPVMNDAALFSKLFGRENTNAAMALIQGIDQVETWTEAITGTNTAVEQSQIIMETYNERLARVQAQFDDFKISVFDASGDFGIWVSVIMQSLTPLAQIAPLIMGIGKAMLFVKALNWGGMWHKIRTQIVATAISLNSFGITMGVASLSFAAFKQAAVSACRAVSVAIMNIPIIGWIAAAIAAVIAIVQVLWDKCKGFRVFVFTLWEAIKQVFGALVSFGKRIIAGVQTIFARIRAFFAGIWAWISSVVDAIVAKILSVCEPVISAFRTVFEKVKGFFSGIIAWIRSKFDGVIGWIIDAYNAAARVFGWKEIKARGRAAAEKSWANDHPSEQPVDADAGIAQRAAGNLPAQADPIAKGINGIGGAADKSERIKNISISIDRLIDHFTIQTTNMQESQERIKTMVAEALLSAVNDVNLAM